MVFISLFLFLGACVGHTALLVFNINWLYGSRFRGWWVTLLRHLHELGIVAGPPTFLYLFGRQLWFTGDWLALPWPLLVYLAICWFLGLVVVPYQTVRRWLRQVPGLQLSNDTQTVDVSRQLGRKPYGDGKRRRLARLPFNEIFQVDFVERTFQLPQLPAAWDGLTILHVTDLHLCGTPALSFYESVFDHYAEQPADILALTGDVLDSDDHYEWIAPVLRRLKWQHGAFAVLGNHDARLDVKRIVREIESAGIEMIGGHWKKLDLRGEPLIVTGSELPWLGPEPDLRGCPEGFRLGLSHTPDVLPWARRQKIDLLLAGHNHGGQIRFPVIGPVLVPSRYSRRYDEGTFYEAPTLMHVGRGLAGTYPIRYNCRPEIVRIVLRSSSVGEGTP